MQNTKRRKIIPIQTYTNGQFGYHLLLKIEKTVAK